MNSFPLRPIAALALVAALAALAGCGPSEAERQAQAQAKMQARMEAEAQKQLGNFQQLKASGRSDLALNVADHVLKTFPQTQAAVVLKAEVEPLRVQMQTEREARRLADLWVYHDEHDADAGGRVRTAYIFARDPLAKQPGKEAARARLVLRRHPQWGDDVYLLSEHGPFACGSPCRLSVTFDGAAARTVSGEIPATGEHAIFVKDFAYFVQHLPEAGVVSIDATLADGSAHTLVFEVGGYDPATIGAR
ncbi:hypothetical protein OS187_05775 [Xanthomonadaceae bacterium JHOS43]|nr:hypothetical protein [Xanthomonadaceae bacterium JHOS43]